MSSKIFLCFDCGTRNRIEDSRDRAKAKCGKCSAYLFPDAQNTSVKKPRQHYKTEARRSGGARSYFAYAIVVLGILLMAPVLLDMFYADEGNSVGNNRGIAERPSPPPANRGTQDNRPPLPKPIFPSPSPANRGAQDSRESINTTTVESVFSGAIEQQNYNPELFDKARTIDLGDNTARTQEFLPPAVVQQPGIVRNWTGRELIAPFTIITASGQNYYIKLVESGSGRDAISIYVTGGNPVKAKVPLGTYEMRYAVGSIWRGEEHLFDPDTRKFKALDVFQFEETSDHIYGYTIELIAQSGGNLDVEEIDDEDF